MRSICLSAVLATLAILLLPISSAHAGDINYSDDGLMPTPSAHCYDLDAFLVPSSDGFTALSVFMISDYNDRGTLVPGAAWSKIDRYWLKDGWLRTQLVAPTPVQLE